MNHAHFPSSPSLTLLFVAWMSSYERGIQLILEPAVEKYVCGFCITGARHRAKGWYQIPIEFILDLSVTKYLLEIDFGDLDAVLFAFVF